jgi:phosphinothricin acetyltransferase
MRIEPMTGAHADGVLEIYQAGIDEGNATFETRAPSWPEFSAARLPDHRFVALGRLAGGGQEADGGPEPPGQRVLGWVAVSPVSARPVYAGVVEHSVYVHRHARGQGTGRALLAALIASTEAAGIWTIESGIFPENTASLALHRAAGFRVVGTRQRIGCHLGRPGHPGGWWRDTILIERRSPVSRRPPG